MRKSFICILCMSILLLVNPICAYATIDYTTSVPYDSYVYNSSYEPVCISSPFSVESIITGDKVTQSGFNNISDMFFDGVEKTYICDTGNNRIIAVDKNFNLLAEISSFDFEGNTYSFTEPQGVWADSEKLYVSDTGNHRIVKFSIKQNHYETSAIFDKPVISALGNDFEYKPTKISVDSTEKIYVVASGINEGLVCLDENGKFLSFLGAPKVEPNILETLWRKFASKVQLSKMQSYVPTEYNSVTMDNNGFLYVTSQTSNDVPVAKLNNSGDDVLVSPKLGSYGDYCYLSKTDASYKPYFTDLALYNSKKIGEDIFYVLDSKQGKIYAYNEEGFLLYAFCSNGTQKGTFYAASAIEYIPITENEGRLIVADSFKNTVTVLKETEFSVSVKSALQLYNSGSYDESQVIWSDIISTDSGYPLAMVNLARIELREGNYKQAMSQMKEIREYDLYADAFEEWRDNFLRDNFGIMIIAVIVVLATVIVLVKVAKKFSVRQRLEKYELYRGYKYGTYVMFHPFDGFWDLKHEKRGNLKSALLIAVLFFLFYALRLQFGGYVVTGVVSEEANVLYHLAILFLPLLFWIIANWCFTTLMDGKGNMKDIVIATCYALKPYVIFGLPMLVLSNVLSASEVVFYTFFDTILLLWVLFLLFASLISTHDYSLGKALLTVVLILIGICLIIFIILLVISIVQNVYQFAYNIIQELSFRSY